MRYMANRNIGQFRSTNQNQYNHNSMAIGKYYIPENNIGNVLMGLITDGKLQMPLVPHYVQNVKFFADVDNYEEGLYLFLY